MQLLTHDRSMATAWLEIQVLARWLDELQYLTAGLWSRRIRQVAVLMAMALSEEDTRSPFVERMNAAFAELRQIVNATAEQTPGGSSHVEP